MAASCSAGDYAVSFDTNDDDDGDGVGEIGPAWCSYTVRR